MKFFFQIEFVLMKTFEMLSFKPIRFVDGERSVVLISPAIIRSLNGIAEFVNNLGIVSPNVVVFVVREGCTDTAGSCSFQREFVSAFEFYTMVMESLDAAAAPPGDLVKKIVEAFVLRPKILTAVETAADRDMLESVQLPVRNMRLLDVEEGFPITHTYEDLSRLYLGYEMSKVSVADISPDEEDIMALPVQAFVYLKRAMDFHGNDEDN
ncbi:unnamed protein product [Brassica rapa]|uniref:Uncharacterized protein n=2 Tax=Brassica TaxID=3705 RepID=A0A8D9GR49_BRACM|nr:unnamed protein product [Brassica napus]CAG7885283.1 unnamed protein product [Brassica rapa]